MREIEFFSADIPFQLDNTALIKNWIIETIENYDKHPEEITLIFCSDSYLLNINKQYLNHDYYTDIITFDYSAEENFISGEIYISINRVKENANFFNVKFNSLLLLPRFTVISTFVPFSPLSISITSRFSMSMPATVSPFTFIILSPACKPAFSDGPPVNI